MPTLICDRCKRPYEGTPPRPPGVPQCDPCFSIRTLQYRVDERNKRIRKLKEAYSTLLAVSKRYIEAHSLMAVRLQDSEDAEEYTAAAKELEAIVDQKDTMRA